MTITTNAYLAIHLPAHLNTIYNQYQFSCQPPPPPHISQVNQLLLPSIWKTSWFSQGACEAHEFFSCSHFYRPQGKVMFSEAFVCPQGVYLQCGGSASGGGICLGRSGPLTMKKPKFRGRTPILCKKTAK